jgi:hypothetical protein
VLHIAQHLPAAKACKQSDDGTSLFKQTTTKMCKYSDDGTDITHYKWVNTKCMNRQGIHVNADHHKKWYKKEKTVQAVKSHSPHNQEKETFGFETTKKKKH